MDTRWILKSAPALALVTAFGVMGAGVSLVLDYSWGIRLLGMAIWLGIGAAAGGRLLNLLKPAHAYLGSIISGAGTVGIGGGFLGMGVWMALTGEGVVDGTSPVTAGIVCGLLGLVVLTAGFVLTVGAVRRRPDPS
ncbi:hypothetical protein [Microlunatus sp. Y2014]|uniref:hypothetical protein n=1 Tax=Microlunatus sp. Y2014 TaxID=3418488 RepID=UPI003DA6DAE7